MDSCEEVNFLSEWEYFEESEFLDNEGEEDYRPLKMNSKAWTKCKKLEADANFHHRYISIQQALSFRDLSNEQKETFVKDKGLTYEDQKFLGEKKAIQCLNLISNAVVCITVRDIKSGSKPAYGTGFLVQVDNEDAVITNSHSIRRNSDKGKGINFVEPGNVRVTSFYNGMPDNAQVTHEVHRIEKLSRPDKNKEKNVLRDAMNKALDGDGTKDSPDIQACKAAVTLLDSYFGNRDAFLDYAFLYLKPLENEEKKARFANVKPLEMRAFEILEHFRNVSSFGFSDPRSSKYPRSLRLFSISHPHCKSQQLSFGGLESDLAHVYFLNMSHGQNDKGMLGGKDPFVEHSIATCPGSSGAPIFLYMYNHETAELVIDEAVYFLHFYGNENGKLHGKAVSFSTIIKNMPFQALHEELESALAEVREYKEESTSE